jgi:glycosyltransferase involved in cell wall biosynthesis
MSAPAFSVVIPAYNSAATIEITVASVLAQKRADLELIVVDDGSTDDTRDRIAAVAERDPRVSLFAQANQGTAAARNAGIARANGPLISFIDHDDLWLPGYLAGMAAPLERVPDAGFAYTDAYLLDDRRRAIRRRTSFEHYPGVPPPPSAPDQLLMLIETNFVMSSTMVPAAVLAEVGGFAAEIRGADDWDLWLRIVASGRPAVAASEPLLVQRDHPASQSKDLAMMFANMEDVIRRLIENPQTPPNARRHAVAKLEQIRRKRERAQARGIAAAGRILRDLRVNLGERLGARRTWSSQPPAAVLDAFGDLSRVLPGGSEPP